MIATALNVSEVPVVYIVDDNVAVRDAIRWLVEEVGLTAKVFDTAQGFLDSFDPESLGCLVLDVRMPGMSGLDLQDLMAQQGATIPIIVITGHGDVPMAVRSMKAGAFEFLQKPFNDQDLLDNIFEAIKVHAELLAKKDRTAQALSNIAALTRRELEVLKLLRVGKSSKSIASELQISVRTVEGHRAKIMSKMQANSLAQLIEFTQQVLDASHQNDLSLI